MLRALLTVCILAVLAAPADADKVHLADGRTLVGVATMDGDDVQIVMEYGAIRVPRSEVASIEVGDTPEAELAKKLAAAPDKDPAALAQIARWAAENKLPRQANEIYNRVLAIEPNNPAARAALDFARVDGEWRPFAQGLELARNKLDAGQTQSLLADVLPPLEGLAGTKERQQALRELAGLAMIRSAKFAAALKAFEELASKSTGPAAVRYAAIAQVLGESPDGMCVLSGPYPPEGDLLGGRETVLKAGPASLTDPRALQAALAEKAKKEIQAARQAIEELKKADSADSARARAAAAGKALDRADALAPGISRSYRVELVRLRIEEVRKEVDRQAKDADKELASLGKAELAAAPYREKLQKLLRLLDVIRDNLKDITDAAKLYPRDLLLEVKWAEADLKKIKEMRDLLVGELDARKQ
jgi:hypothetical protein